MHAGLTEGFDVGEEACLAGRAAGGAVLFDLKVVYKKERRVVEIEIRVEIESREEHHLLLRVLLLRSIRRPQRLQ